MSDGTKATSRGWREKAAELADELRAVCESLAVRDLEHADLDEAVALARALHRSLEGPPHPRWYDADEDPLSLSERSRRAYLDQSPIRGRLNPVAPPLRTEIAVAADGSREIAGRARLGTAYEGPPHGVHGGWVAALFDDVLGSAQGLARSAGVTARLEVRFRHVTPVDEELRLRAWIDREDSRRVVARATCHAGETLTAEAEGLFLRVDWSEVQRRMRGRREQR
jgi:acyl-coenzyme A thioesterase PaaI-like protein